MDRRSDKRRLTWFGKTQQPNTLGRMWQQTPQGDHETDNWTLREPIEPEIGAERGSRLSDWSELPPLPKWPPLPGEDPFARDATQVTEPHLAAQQEQSALGQSGRLDQQLRRFWQSLISDRRRRWIALAAIAGVVVLCSLGSVAVLGNAFRAGALLGGNGTSPAGNANGNVALTPGLSTPMASPSSSPTVTVSAAGPFTIAFTCASGVNGGRGEVCVHTEPNATVTLTVRYCDGNYAGGKAFRGIAHTDGSGDYTWHWDVSTSCIGTATAAVTVKSGGQTITQSTTFTVTN